MRFVHCASAKTISSTLGDREIVPNRLFKGLKELSAYQFSHEPHLPSDNMCFVEKVKDVYIELLMMQRFISVMDLQMSENMGPLCKLFLKN